MMFQSFLKIIRKKQIYALLAVALIVIGTLIVAFHHHDDGKIHVDCPICRLQESGLAALVNQKIIVIVPHVFICCYLIFLSSIINKTFIHKSAYPHAPPFIS
ncbi:MAG: hypothetical protein V1874_05060 [Spirochaetota bacterium]